MSHQNGLTEDKVDAMLAAAPAVSAHLDDLEHLRDAAYDKLQGASKRSNEAKEAHQAAERELAEAREYEHRNNRSVERRDPDTGVVSRVPDTARSDAAQKRAHLAAEKLERARFQYKRISDEWNASAGVVNAVMRYLEQLPRGAELVPVEAKTAKPGKGESFADAVERVRGQIRDLDALVRETKSAPIPAQKAKEIARAYVQKLAAEGRPDVSQLLKRGADPKWPNQPLQGFNVNGMIPQLAKALPVIAWMHQDALVAAMEREIDAETEISEGAISDDDRKFKLMELADDRLDLEHQEESLIRQAAEDGIEIMRRRGADPRAVLGLSKVMPAAK